MMKRNKILSAALCLTAIVVPLVVAGCGSSEDNPISPDRMNQIRKQEADQRANFHPNVAPPPR